VGEVALLHVDCSCVVRGREYDDPPPTDSTRIRIGERSVRGGMPTPELISLIVALVVWIVLLGTLAADG
jgi:hypothetical protein